MLSQLRAPIGRSWQRRVKPGMPVRPEPQEMREQLGPQGLRDPLVRLAQQVLRVRLEIQV